MGGRLPGGGAGTRSGEPGAGRGGTRCAAAAAASLTRARCPLLVLRGALRAAPCAGWPPRAPHVRVDLQLKLLPAPQPLRRRARNAGARGRARVGDLEAALASVARGARTARNADQ
jgi:hypothetical protein